MILIGEVWGFASEICHLQFVLALSHSMVLGGLWAMVNLVDGIIMKMRLWGCFSSILFWDWALYLKVNEMFMLSKSQLKIWNLLGWKFLCSIRGENMLIPNYGVSSYRGYTICCYTRFHFRLLVVRLVTMLRRSLGGERHGIWIS